MGREVFENAKHYRVPIEQRCLAGEPLARFALPNLTACKFQFNFQDHSKVILSSRGLLVTHIDKNYQLTRWHLSEVIAASLRYAEPRGTVGVAPDQVKFNQKLVDKLKYCKEILLSIKSATGGSAASEGKA